MRLDRGQIEVMDEAMVEVYRRKTPAQRLAVAFGLWSATRQFLLNVVRDQHPNWGDQRVRREVARRMSGGAI